MSTVILTLLDRTLVHLKYLSSNVGTYLQLSRLPQIGSLKLTKLPKGTMYGVDIELTTQGFRVQHLYHLATVDLPSLSRWHGNTTMMSKDCTSIL